MNGQPCARRYWKAPHLLFCVVWLGLLLEPASRLCGATGDEDGPPAAANATAPPTPVPAAWPLAPPPGLAAARPDGPESASREAREPAGTADRSAFRPTGSGASTRVDVCGTISTDTTWTADNLYVVTCIVTVPAGVTLGIEPGTVVKLQMRDFFVHGTLLAEGTAEAPVVFTSYEDDAHGGDTNADGPSTGQPGQWAALTFEAESVGRLAHTILQYGGGYYFHYDSRALVRSFGGDVALEDVMLRNSGGHGLYAESPVALRDSRVADNAEWGLYFYGLGTTGLPLDVTGNVFAGGRPGLLRLDGEPGPITIEDNRIEGPAGGFAMRGVLRNSLRWENAPSFVLLVASNLEVAPTGMLRLAPGTIVKLTFGASDGGELIVNGALEAVGTTAAPIVFTSLQDDEVGGDTNGDGAATRGQPGQWSAITFGASGRGSIAHAVVRYGGGYYFHYSNKALIRNFSDAVALEDVELTQSGWYGVYAENGPMLLRRCRIAANAAYGIFNYTPTHVVDARRNWWGDASGPLHPTKNPNGRGDRVSDGVLFFPWAVDPEGTVPSQVLVSGPTRVSPGETVDYSVSYFAGTSLTDAVLRLPIPAFATGVGGREQPPYWPELRQVFWRLGDLAADEGGTKSVRVRYAWGLASGLENAVTAELAAAELPAFDTEPYRAYVAPARLAERTPLSAAELAAERVAHSQFDALYQSAVESGHVLARASRSTLSDGRTMVEALLVKQGGVVWVDRIDDVVGSLFVDRSAYGLRGAFGSVRIDRQTDAAEVVEARAASHLRAPPEFTYGQCMRSCFLQTGAQQPFKELSWGALPILDSPVCRDCYIGIPGKCELCAAAVESFTFKEYEPFLDRTFDRHPDIGLDACDRQCATPGPDRDRFKCPPGYAVQMCEHGPSLLSFLPGLSNLEAGGTPSHFRQYPCEGGVYGSPGPPVACPPGQECVLVPSVFGGTVYGGCRACAPPAPAPAPVVWDEPSNCAGGRSAAIDVCSRLTTQIRVAKDPNAKHAPAGEVIPGQTMTYTVEYENVGEGRAFGVYVTDELSPHLDETTLDLGGEGEFTPITRRILWEIGELAPKGQEGSKGERTFTIRVKPDSPSGTVITNQATVYFPSVPEETATNTVVNVVQSLVAVPQRVETAYGTPISVSLVGRDVSDTPLTYSIEALPMYGELSGVAPNLTYTPAENFTGPDRFTFSVSNGVSTSPAADVGVLVNPSAADTTAPEVVWTYPEDASSLAEVSASPVFTDDAGSLYAPSVLVGFSEPMDETTITAAAVVVRDAHDRVVDAAVSWDGTLNQVVLVPRQPWQDGTYTAMVTTDARDASGNPLAAEHSWSFRVGEAPAVCAGDCDGDRSVTVDDLIRGVNIALGWAAIAQCPSFDADFDGTVTVEELIGGVNNAINGCPAPGRAATAIRRDQGVGSQGGRRGRGRTASGTGAAYVPRADAGDGDGPAGSVAGVRVGDADQRLCPLGDGLALAVHEAVLGDDVHHVRPRRRPPKSASSGAGPAWARIRGRAARGEQPLRRVRGRRRLRYGRIMAKATESAGHARW